MTSCLLDVNALIALIDSTHVHHERAHQWFLAGGSQDWITVPITENGVVRIVSHPNYSNTQPVHVAMSSLRSVCAVGGHRFEPDAVSLLDVDDPILSSNQVTDTYLVALSRSLGGKLATFDRKIATSTARGTGDAVLLIP